MQQPTQQQTEEVIYVPTPIDIKPEKSGWYHVLNLNKEILSRMVYFTGGQWDANYEFPHWLKPYTVEEYNGEMAESNRLLEMELDGYKEELAQLKQDKIELLEAMQHFVDRVDKGEVRSKRTYASFKELIQKHKQ